MTHTIIYNSHITSTSSSIVLDKQLEWVDDSLLPQLRTHYTLVGYLHHDLNIVKHVETFFLSFIFLVNLLERPVPPHMES